MSTFDLKLVSRVLSDSIIEEDDKSAIFNGLLSDLEELREFDSLPADVASEALGTLVFKIMALVVLRAPTIYTPDKELYSFKSFRRTSQAFVESLGERSFSRGEVFVMNSDSTEFYFDGLVKIATPEGLKPALLLKRVSGVEEEIITPYDAYGTLFTRKGSHYKD